MVGGAVIGGVSAVNVGYCLSVFSNSAATYSSMGTVLRWGSFTAQSTKYLSALSTVWEEKPAPVYLWDNFTWIPTEVS